MQRGTNTRYEIRYGRGDGDQIEYWIHPPRGSDYDDEFDYDNSRKSVISTIKALRAANRLEEPVWYVKITEQAFHD